MKRCDDLVVELQKMRSHNARENERYKLQSKSAKQQWMAQEKLKREEWVRVYPILTVIVFKLYFLLAAAEED